MRIPKYALACALALMAAQQSGAQPKAPALTPGEQRIERMKRDHVVVYGRYFNINLYYQPTDRLQAGVEWIIGD